MKCENRKISGLLLFVGGVQCVLGIIIAEAFYPGYSTADNYISDLGVGPSAIIFNSSLFLLGVTVITAVYFIHQEYKYRPLSFLFAMAGIGAIGVGLFTEDTGFLHVIFSLIIFLFGGLSAILSYKLEKPPLSYLSVLLGTTSLVALVFFASGVHLGLGNGGIERMIAYPTLLWLIGFGGYLIGFSSEKSESNTQS